MISTGGRRHLEMEFELRVEREGLHNVPSPLATPLQPRPDRIVRPSAPGARSCDSLTGSQERCEEGRSEHFRSQLRPSGMSSDTSATQAFKMLQDAPRGPFEATPLFWSTCRVRSAKCQALGTAPVFLVDALTPKRAHVDLTRSACTAAVCTTVDGANIQRNFGVRLLAYVRRVR